jgi:hypothetical protein
MLYLIGLLFIAAPVLLIFNRLKVRYVFSWFWTICVCVVVWGGILTLRGSDWAQPMIPLVFPLIAWGEGGVDSPVLLLDAISWPFALALSGLGLGVVLTSAQRLADIGTAQEEGSEEITTSYEDWRNQAAILTLLWLGLFGVLAGNPLTLLLAWAGADLLGVWVLLRRITGREESERIVLDFSARVAGTLLLIWTMAVARSDENPLGFEQIPAGLNVYLLLACGFRLGVLPLQVYFFHDLPLRRGLGTIARMAIPAVSSLVLLVRIASTGMSSGLGVPLLVLTAFTGLYAGFYWVLAKNEMEGRSFWMLGMGSLAMASAIRGQPMAVQAWGLALLLGGGGLFLFSARSLGLRVLLGISAMMISALPWTPTILGMGLYSGEFSWSLFPFLLIHGLLLAGFVRHVLREGEPGQVSVRAIRAAYTLGLLVLPGTLILAGGIDGVHTLPDIWWASLVGVGLAALFGIWASRARRMSTEGWSAARRFFSFHWLYRLLWRGYRLLGGGVAFITVLLEGEAGVLWTLLLLFLLISLITTQAGLGG